MIKGKYFNRKIKLTPLEVDFLNKAQSCEEPHFDSLIDEMVSKKLSNEFYLKLVDESPEIFNALPPEVQSFELCCFAMSKNGLMLSEVDLKFKTLEVCLIAVSENSLAIDCVPNQIKELCELALNKNPESLYYMFQTPELCLYALDKSESVKKNIKIIKNAKTKPLDSVISELKGMIKLKQNQSYILDAVQKTKNTSS